MPSTEQSQPEPEPRRAWLVAGLLVAVVGIAAIVAIPPWLASEEAAGCIATSEDLQAFTPTETPPAVPTAPMALGDGSTRTLADYAGRGVLLNFWATWCAPCVREMPELDRLNAKLKGDGIDVLTVSQDRAGFKVIDKFFDANKLRNLERLHDPGGKLARGFKLRGLPTTIFINAKGLEVGRIAGIAEYDTPVMQAFARRCLSPG